MASDKARREMKRRIEQLKSAGVQIPRQPSRREVDVLWIQNSEKLAAASA
jgi:hypothetical protein